MQNFAHLCSSEQRTGRWRPAYQFTRHWQCCQRCGEAVVCLDMPSRYFGRNERRSEWIEAEHLPPGDIIIWNACGIAQHSAALRLHEIGGKQAFAAAVEFFT